MKIRSRKYIAWVSKYFYATVWMLHHYVVVNVEIRVVMIFVLPSDENDSTIRELR